MRQLKPRAKAEVKALRDKKGVEAAIRTAKPWPVSKVLVSVTCNSRVALAH